MSKERKFLKPDRTLRLDLLSPAEFELFWFRYLETHPILAINRNGRLIERRVLNASTYAREGRDQKGIDIRIEMEGGEVWALQAKRVNDWKKVSKTQDVIEKARAFGAAHNFLALSWNPPANIHEGIARHPNWTLWNLDSVCNQLSQVPPEKLKSVLSFLQPDELIRFAPFATEALIEADDFFKSQLNPTATFRHDWKLVGRKQELSALKDFASDPGRQVFILLAAGGRGKSRLLLEFARSAGNASRPVLFLNPHSRDSLELALTREGPLIVIADDAHRMDPLLRDLIRYAAAREDTKLVLATRPQGEQPLYSDLAAENLLEARTPLALPELSRADILQLARAALRKERQSLAGELIGLANGSPFLVTLAGDLVARREIRWGDWVSHEDFRARVFRAFEEENFRGQDAASVKIQQRLLRVLALVAPVTLDEEFCVRLEKAGFASRASVAEESLGLLKRAGLLTSDAQATRVTPDLFADFLVHDACFASDRRGLSLAREVRIEFPSHIPAMLRNAAETGWIAARAGEDTESFFLPLVEHELGRFREVSFRRRVAILEDWRPFCAFLPEPTLALVTEAMRLDTEGREKDEDFLKMSRFWRQTTHADVLDELPALLEPLILYHEAVRPRALDTLWNLNLTQLSKAASEAWHAVAKWESGITGDVVTWLAGKLRVADSLAILDRYPALLGAILRPVFARLVEQRSRSGTMFSFWSEPIHIDHTAKPREQARGILRHVIEHGTWRAALAAIEVASTGLDRIPKGQMWVDDVNAFRIAWRGERLAALDLIRAAVQHHGEPALRYSARRTLRRDAQFDEDTTVRKACLALAREIPEDARLRLATALVSEGSFEEEDDSTPSAETLRKRRESWAQKRTVIFEEFLASHRDAHALVAEASALAAHLKEGGLFGNPARLFTHVAEKGPAFALEVAHELLTHFPDDALTRFWTCLIPSAERGTDAALSLLELATRQADSVASCATLPYLLDPRLANGVPPHAAECELLCRIAARAGCQEAFTILHALELSPPDDAGLVWAVLSQLPLEEHADALFSGFLDAFAEIHAHTPFSREQFRILLQRFLRVSDADIDDHPEAMRVLGEAFPFEALEFFQARIELEISGHAPEKFHPIPEMRIHWIEEQNLKALPEFRALRDKAWQAFLDQEDRVYLWRKFLALFIVDDAEWLDAHLAENVARASSIPELRRLTAAFSFHGSLLIFRRPELARQFLAKSIELDPEKGESELRAALYTATGPRSHGWTGGRLNPEDDYVEAEAEKAAARHENDPILYSLFCWIVERERSFKKQILVEHEVWLDEMAAE